jgi:tRNA threonylcarbamoyladenosine biosynthesis protein TsaE
MRRNHSTAFTRLTHSQEETEAQGESLAARLAPGDVVALFGGLGAGKTAFARGLARGLGCGGDACSPTYALVHEYAGPRPMAHFDMYRVGGPDELESTGWYDYLGSGHILAVEWSENIAEALPEGAWRVEITYVDENTRDITIRKGAAP